MSPDPQDASVEASPAPSGGPPESPRRSLSNLLRWLVGRHWTWIDAHATLPPGRVSAAARVTIVYAVGALSLTLISYGVLRGDVQGAVGRAMLRLVGALAPGAERSIGPYRKLAEHLVWSLGCFTFYFLLPALVTRRVLGHRLRDYGLSGRGYWRHLPIYVGLFLPVGLLVLAVASSPDFQRQYPFYHHPVGVWDLALWEVFYALQFFSLEFFFRGFLLHGVKDRLGRYAIFAMVVPYVMIHFRKPLYETLGAVLAGTALGTLSLRTGSIWGGVTIHVAVAVSMDLAALAMRPS